MPCLVVIVLPGVMAGCGAAKAKKGSEPSAAEVEHSEELAQHKQEAAETTSDQELLVRIEAKKREEAAEENAQRTEALAAARAKKKEQAAVREAKHKEKLAEANAKKREEASKAAAKKVKEEEQRKLADERAKHAAEQAKPTSTQKPPSSGATLQGQTSSTGHVSE